MRIFQEEVFGPFTSVTPFKDEADALRLANDSPFGLAAAIRTRDVARAHRVAASVKAGIVWVNDHHRLDPASPWGGVADSGIGRECGTESFDDHFNTKSVMVATHDAAIRLVSRHGEPEAAELAERQAAVRSKEGGSHQRG